jgi:hypothetical protein
MRWPFGNRSTAGVSPSRYARGTRQGEGGWGRVLIIRYSQYLPARLLTEDHLSANPGLVTKTQGTSQPLRLMFCGGEAKNRGKPERPQKALPALHRKQHPGLGTHNVRPRNFSNWIRRRRYFARIAISEADAPSSSAIHVNTLRRCRPTNA